MSAPAGAGLLRAAVLLVDVEEFAYKEVAEILSVSAKTDAGTKALWARMMEAAE